MPATSPSAGVRSMSSSRSRRLRWAATSSGPYSTKDPGSTRSSTFSRAVRWLRDRRRATASGRASSRTQRVAFEHLGQIGPQGRGLVVAGACRGRVAVDEAVTPDSPGLMAVEVLGPGHGLAGEHRGADGQQHLADDPVGLGGDHVLHLHGLHHGHRGAGGHDLARGDPELDHGALDGRADVGHGAIVGRARPPRSRPGQRASVQRPSV